MSRGLVVPALIAGVLFGAAVTARASTPEELFVRGNAAYESGRFDEAASAYTEALRLGARDSRLEFNLANACFKLGRLGEAVLHYERAVRLDPTDADIRGNLALVRSLLRDRVEEDAGGSIPALGRLQDRLGPDRQAITFLVLLWAGAAFIAWRSARPRGWKPAAGWTVAALLAMLLLVGLSWWTTLARLETGRPAVILAPEVQVLAGPGEHNAALFTVHEGLAVEIRSERHPWVQVSLPNGLHGWVRRDALEAV